MQTIFLMYNFNQMLLFILKTKFTVFLLDFRGLFLLMTKNQCKYIIIFSWQWYIS